MRCRKCLLSVFVFILQKAFILIGQGHGSNKKCAGTHTATTSMKGRLSLLILRGMQADITCRKRLPCSSTKPCDRQWI